MTATTCTAILFFLLLGPSHALAQSPPTSADRPWHSAQEGPLEDAAKKLREGRFEIDATKTYSLTELIDVAEGHNPETRVAWERARAQAATRWVSRTVKLYPTLAAAALSGTGRSEVLFGDKFFRQTVQDFDVVLELNYTVFDFGARSGRINAAKAQVLAANFAFNDTHRDIIFQAAKTYYRLLNALGQEDAARASLANAQTVQQAAEDRLAHGLATLPDVAGSEKRHGTGGI